MEINTFFLAREVGDLIRFTQIAKLFGFGIKYKPTATGQYTHKINCSISDFYTLIEIANE